MNFHPKIQIIELFLAFVRQYADLSSACLATLGGEGLEAALWQRENIDPKRGWLIECQRRFRKKLILRHRFRNCSHLHQFPHLYQSVWGKRRGIDGFHLDLCGTYESGDKAFQPSIPLIMRSRGRCLAVTVADQRRNQSLDNFVSVRAQAEQLFGIYKVENFFQALLREHGELHKEIKTPTDPVKSAERELGFVMKLISALEKNRANRIDRMERYFYSSVRNGRPFRMRTYFFHFAEKSWRMSRAEYAANALRLWYLSAIQVVSERGIKDLSFPSKPTKEATVAQLENYANLKALAEAAGGPAFEQFKHLIARIVVFDDDAKLGQEVRALVQKTNGQLQVPAAALAPEITRKSRKSVKANKSDIDFLFGLLREQAKGEKELAAAKKREAKERYGRAKNGLSRVGTTFARTQGGHSAGFAKRVLKLRPELFGELARLYGQPEDQLRKEAEAYKHPARAKKK